VKVYQHAAISEDKKSLTMAVIFTTNNVAQYGVQLTFDITNFSGGSVLSNKLLVYIINRYGNWDAALGLFMQDGYFAIPYQSEGASFVAVYKM
jgi:hypothetical protein